MFNDNSMARLIFLLLFPVLVSAQGDLFPRLAIEVCDCMEQIVDEVPRMYARNCLRIIGRAHQRTLSRVLGGPFNPDDPRDLDLLADQLSPTLADDCPILQTMYKQEEERELRWSDLPQASSNDSRMVFPKNPPADGPGRITGERPPTIVVSGIVTARSRQSLRLRTEDGEELDIRIPANKRRSLGVEVGQTVRLDCGREWLLEEDRVQLVIR